MWGSYVHKCYQIGALCISFVWRAWAQDSIGRYEIQLVQGLTHLRVSDPLMSVLTYEGWLYHSAFSYSGHTLKTSFHAEVSFTTGRSFPDVLGKEWIFRTAHRIGAISVCYLQKMADSGRWRWWAGGSWWPVAHYRRNVITGIFGEFLLPMFVMVATDHVFYFRKQSYYFMILSGASIFTGKIGPQYAYSPPPGFFSQNSYLEKGKWKRVLKSIEWGYFPSLCVFTTRFCFDKALTPYFSAFLCYDFFLSYYARPHSTWVGSSTGSIGCSVKF